MALFIAFLSNLFVTSISAKTFQYTPEANNVTIFNAVNRLLFFGILIQNLHLNKNLVLKRVILLMLNMV
jgi:hypothetical protein